MRLLPLVAGPLSMSFDQDTAFLRHLRLGRTEVLRGVFAAVRDQDWNTIPCAVHDLQVDTRDDCFALSFVAQCAQDGVRFDWHGEIIGSAEGVVEFVFRGIAKSSFKRNRIGLCVLHPIDGCAGQACRVLHTDGSITHAVFPDTISPHQPLKDIKSIEHRVRDDVHVSVTFEGDVFEMEDQRNWTDASYKTYSTPLDIPFPVEVPAGQEVEQSVVIRLSGPSASQRRERVLSSQADDSVRVEIDWARSHPLPAIGLGLSTSSTDPCSKARDRLREIHLRHVRVDLWLDDPAWEARAKAALALAADIDTQLELALFVENTSQRGWQDCLELLSAHRPRIARWLVLHPRAKSTPSELAESACRQIYAFSPNAEVAVGTNAYFAELNRNRPTLGGNESVCFSINPQVHAFDKLSMRETLAGQRAAVESAYSIFQCAVVVSPITLLPRFNPNATSAASNRIEEPATDPRQATPFAAAWTTGVVQQLAAHERVSSLTLFETHGPRGILSAAGETYPVLDVVREVLASRAICEASVSQPLDIAVAALLHADGSRRLLLANMDEHRHTVAVKSRAGHELLLALAPESVRVLSAEDLR